MTHFDIFAIVVIAYYMLSSAMAPCRGISINIFIARRTQCSALFFYTNSNSRWA